MEQFASQLGEFNETADRLADNILTTFTFEKRSDSLSISVAGFSALAPIFDAIKGIKGVIYWQGEAIPVIDLKLKCGSCATRIGDSACIILVEHKQKSGTRKVGILVDDISDVFSIAGRNMKYRGTRGTNGYGQTDDEADDCHGLAETLMNIDRIIGDIDYSSFRKSI